MREYIRMDAPGAAFFLTLVTFERRPILAASANVDRLRAAFRYVINRRPMVMHGAFILPDHVHVLIELPAGDADFSTRIARVKAAFSRSIERRRTDGCSPFDEPPPSPSRLRRRERAIWQRRFWEHTIRDDRDFEAHMDYIHYNPVKHGYAKCPHDWPHSSFHTWVRAGHYPPHWACSCQRPAKPPSSLDLVQRTAAE